MKHLSFVFVFLVACCHMLFGDFRCEVGVDAPASVPGWSLCFGVSAEEAQEPLPPFSAMFGIKECFLVHPSNTGETASQGGELSRLRVDLRQDASRPWLMQVNANLTLYFSIIEGLHYCVETPQRDGTFRRRTGPLPASLELKANSRLAIAASPIEVVPAFAEPADQRTVFVVPSDHFRAERSLTVPEGEAILAFAAGAADIVLLANGRYYCNDGTVSGTLPTACDWLVELDAVVTSYAASIAVLETTGGLLHCTFIACNPDTVPITATALQNRLHWLVKRFGTLDFDQNGMIDLNDVLYLYHFVQNGCPTFEDDWFTADQLAPLTESATPEQLQTALDTLRDPDAALVFDDRAVPDLDNVLYFYNFVQNGLPGAEEDWFSAAQLAPLTESATPDQLQTALDTLRELTW